MNDIIVSKENAKIKIKFLHLFLFNFVFLLLCYFPNLQMRFSIDSFSQIVSGINGGASSGRFLSHAIELIQRLFSHPILNQQYYFLANICLISICCLILMRIYIFLCDKVIIDLSELIIVNFCFLLGFINFIIQEFYCFPEMYLQYAFGLFFATLSIYKFFINKSYLISLIYLFMSLCFYQICAQEYCILIILFLLMKYKWKLNKQYFIDIIKTILIFGFANLLNLICIKAYSSDNRLTKFTLQDLKEQFIIVVNHFYNYLKYPFSTVVGVMIYLIFALIIIEVCTFIYKKQYYLCTVLFLFGLVTTCLIFILQIPTLGIWPVPRTLIGLGFIPCSLLLIMFLKTKISFKWFYVLLFCIFFVNLYYISSLSINHTVTNRLDNEFILNIYNRICDYEEKNEIEIKNISFCKDTSPCWSYESNCKNIYSNIGKRELMVDWGQIEIINYYSHRNFQKIDMPQDIYEKYFANKNWDYYKPEEQFVFIDDTLYICVY